MKDTRAVVLIVCMMMAAYVWQWDARRQGRNEGRAESAKARVETLTVRVAQFDTIYRDKLRSFTKWDTIYQHISDTIVVESPNVDITPPPRTTYVNKALADSTISMCRQTLFALQSSCATKDTLVLALRSQLKAQQNAQPSRLSRYFDKALWGLAGYGIGRVTR